MAEYIKREDALSVAHKIGKKEYDWGNVSNVAIVMVVEDELRAIPAADVVERKHGKWITKYPLSTCSVCEQTMILHDFANYCPNCGADMRGDNDG